MKKHSRLLSILLLAALLCLSACTQRGEEPAAVEETPAPVMADPTEVPEAPVAPEATEATEETEETVTPEPTETPVAADTTLRDPLTGKALTEAGSALRPFAVQMNNHQDALPQCGISNAAVIYEMPEEGITRMTAIYPQDLACEHLGSVRSARPYHSEVAKSYDAIFVHWGASTRGAESVYQLHANDDVDFCGNASAYSYREPSRANRATEHTGFVTIEKLNQFLSDNNRRTTHDGEKDYGFRFSDNVALTGGSAQSMKVFFVSKESDFTYSADKGGYTMSQYHGIDYVDGDTNEPVVFRNVVFLRASFTDESSLASIALQNAEGAGVLCIDGQQEQITWKHGDYDDCFHYYLSDGTEANFGVGRSYICIISYNDNLVIE